MNSPAPSTVITPDTPAGLRSPTSARPPTRFPAGTDRLRVALIAGTLRQGGAEKQAVYMARALRDAGVDVRLYCLTRGEFHEARLRALGVPPRWVGRRGNPALRLLALAREFREFRPQIVQACHFFTTPLRRRLGPDGRGPLLRRLAE